MFKNVASQKWTLLAIDTSTNTPKTGDAANITAYVSKDDGAVTALTDTTAAELDATNAPGLYAVDVTQTETNADKLVFSAKSSTSNIKVIPQTIYTLPANFTSSVAQTGDSFARLGAPILASISADIQAIDDFIDGEIAQIIGYIDAEVDAIKTKTDSLTYTKALELDVNLQSINGTTVNGDGGITPWGP